MIGFISTLFLIIASILLLPFVVKVVVQLFSAVGIILINLLLLIAIIFLSFYFIKFSLITLAGVLIILFIIAIICLIIAGFKQIAKLFK